MLTIDPSSTPIPDLHQYLVGAVAPRPIAFASTMSENGTANLAPYSFFNVFGSNPPVLVFSSNRRVRGNTTKDTLHNVEATGEVVINIVNYAIVKQMTLASIEYPEDISEFDKSGLTPIASDLVKPFRVKESPVQMECKVKEIMPLGTEGGAGHLIICDILRIHLNENILNEQGRIDPHKADLMGRMGRAWYVRASGANVFPIVQSPKDLAIGFDCLPDDIKRSTVLTGNDLAALASVTELPQASEEIMKEPRMMDIIAGNLQDQERQFHLYAQELVVAGEIAKAWQVLLVE